MVFERLNGDSSWLCTIAGKHWLIDPWLMGTQVDGFAWFSEQWHVLPCKKPSDLPELEGIIISHPFTDHCHKETLLQLPKETPIFGSKSIVSMIKSWYHFDHLHELPPYTPITYGSLEISFWSKSRWYDPVHDGLFLKDLQNGETAVYCPHGMRLDLIPNEINPITHLISTSIQYQLPVFLGGTINLGVKNLEKLIQRLQPKHIHLTHNEKKGAKGLVSILAQVQWHAPLPVGEQFTIHQ